MSDCTENFDDMPVESESALARHRNNVRITRSSNCTEFRAVGFVSNERDAHSLMIHVAEDTTIWDIEKYIVNRKLEKKGTLTNLRNISFTVRTGSW